MDDISNAVADDLASLEKKSAELGEQMGAMMEGQLKELAAAQFASDEALAEQTAKMARVEHVIQTQLSDGLGDLAGSLEVRSTLSTMQAVHELDAEFFTPLVVADFCRCSSDRR